ncbi:MAG: ABC transporter ATP-binding protein [Bacillota bacterium]|nr:ABC transporter ATP-binding protein [Bacillota bacterium]
MVEVKNVVKRYGRYTAVNNVSFTAERGEILGFLGPNGAGKSTTMNIMTGYISSTSGTVTINGHEILEEPIETKREIGFLPEIPPLYGDMTVRKYLEFIFQLKKVTLPKKEHINEICEKVKLTNVLDRIIKNLSKGYQQRVGFASALIGYPPVLIFDEPTVGLDPKQILEMRQLIRSLRHNHLVILSSHVLSEVQAICDRVIIINNGRLVADAKTDELSVMLEGFHKLSLEIEGRSAEILSILKNIDGVISAEISISKSSSINTYIITSDKDTDLRRVIFRAMSKADKPILAMHPAEMSLEEAFLRLTTTQTSTAAKKTKSSAKNTKTVAEEKSSAKKNENKKGE